MRKAHALGLGHQTEQRGSPSKFHGRPLATPDYRTALELLTEAGVADGALDDDVVARYRERTAAASLPAAVDDVLRLLEHDGYLESRPGGARSPIGLGWALASAGTWTSRPCRTGTAHIGSTSVSCCANATVTD